MNIVAYKPSDIRINRQQLAQHLRQMLQQVIILIVFLDYLFYLRCEKGIQSLEWSDKPDNACRINATSCHFAESHGGMWAIPLFRKWKRNIN